MQITRILCLCSLSACAFGAVNIPKEPAAPAVPKSHISFNTNQKLPELKAPQSKTSATPLYVFELQQSYTHQTYQNAIQKLHAKSLPAYCVKAKDKYQIIVGPDLSESHLKKLMSEVHLSPKMGTLKKVTVKNLEQNIC